MKRPIIGIIGQPSGWNDSNPFTNRYYFLDNYSKVIKDYKAIPVGILPTNLEIDWQDLELYDGFLMCGGTKIVKYHLDIIDFAYKHNKPFLGICCGMQALAMYSQNKTEEMVLEKITNEDHDMKVSFDNIDDTKHEVKLSKNNILYNILNLESLKVNSFHNYKVTKIGKGFKISAQALDKTIEAIECNDKNKYMIGVQWHPELMNNMSLLFESFIKKCE